MPVLFALASAVLWGSVDFLGGLASRRRSSASVVAASQVFGLLAVVALIAMTGTRSAGLGWLGWSVAAGLAGTTGLVLFYAALAAGTMSVVSPIAALGAVVPLLVGIASGERPSGLSGIGLLLALAGAVAASGPELQRGHPGAATIGARPVIMAAAAGVGFGLALTFLERGAASNVIFTLAGMRAVGVALFILAAVLGWWSAGRRLVVAVLGHRAFVGLTGRDLPLLAVIGIGDVAANWLFALASQQGLLSITAVLGSLYPVATVVLARIFLSERLARVQLIGVVAALAGIALVALGRAGA